MKRFVASERRAMAMYIGAMSAILTPALLGMALRAANVFATGDVNVAVVTGLFVGGGLGVMFAILALKTEETERL